MEKVARTEKYRENCVERETKSKEKRRKKEKEKYLSLYLKFQEWMEALILREEGKTTGWNVANICRKS